MQFVPLCWIFVAKRPQTHKRICCRYACLVEVDDVDLPLLRGRGALVCLSWYGGLPLVLIHLTIAEFLLGFHRFSTNDCRGSGPRRRCLHSSPVIRRLTSTSGLRQWPLPLLSSMRKWRTFFTDADPTSHRVRLWRGGSASSLFFLSLLLFVR